MINGSRTVSVVGLGKLGAPLATVLASKGFTVRGLDVSAETIKLFNDGTAPVDETGLQDLLDDCRERISATRDFSVALENSEATFVVVPTPSRDDGLFSIDFVLEAVRGIGAALKLSGAQDHLVVITSTVAPGSTGGPIRAALEGSSGLVVGQSVGLCYSPEFIALGTVIRDLLYPDLILVGASDARSGERLAELLSAVSENDPPVMHMNLVNAELAKLAVNTFVTTKISYANMLAELCERLPGADAAVVTVAVGLDSRIGSKYLQPATPYGGPCFPRDNAALAASARGLGVSADLAEATDTINRRQLTRLADLVCSRLPPGGQAAILGLAYKPGTSVADASTGVELAAELRSRGVRTSVYDPAAGTSAQRILGDGVAYAESMQGCVRGAAVVVVATAWDEFKQLDHADLAGNGLRPMVIDCWRILDQGQIQPVADVVTPGRSYGSDEYQRVVVEVPPRT